MKGAISDAQHLTHYLSLSQCILLSSEIVRMIQWSKTANKLNKKGHLEATSKSVDFGLMIQFGFQQLSVALQKKKVYWRKIVSPKFQWNIYIYIIILDYIILYYICGWETWTEYHCTPTKVFLSFSQSLRRPPTVAMWLKAQAIQLAQGPIKLTGSIPSPTWSEKVQRHLPLGGDLREGARL